MSENRKVGHVLLSRIHPSPENDELYRPVNPKAPDIRALAESIQARGLLEPLTLTEDFFILSGHRRFVACRLAGLRSVECEVMPGVHHADPEFVPLLREFNRHRVKGVDEVLREALVDATEDDEDAIDAVLLDRERRAEVELDALAIAGTKRRKAISGAKGPFLAAIQRVIQEQREFWPLSDRQIHYRLLNDPPLIHASKPGRYANNKKCYASLTELLTRARLEGLISWGAISDPTRPITTWQVHPNVQPFIQKQLEGFLTGYFRDYQQSQPHHIEIVGEKNTVQSLIHPVAMEFCVPYTIGRGYASLQPRYDLWRRFKDSGKERLVLLMLSDFDPDGEEIAQSFARSMRDDFGVQDIFPLKVVLTRDQVEELALVPVMQAKEGSSNFEKFVEQHGNDVFELEAVPPKRLQALLREAILSVLDVDALNREREQERADILALRDMKGKVKIA
jgi:hypothetical protein